MEKQFTYYLHVPGKKTRHSCHFEKLLNMTTDTTNAVITCGGRVVWVQNPSEYYMNMEDETK